jgi:hypothetical protein
MEARLVWFGLVDNGSPTRAIQFWCTSMLSGWLILQYFVDKGLFFKKLDLI